MTRSGFFRGAMAGLFGGVAVAAPPSKPVQQWEFTSYWQAYEKPAEQHTKDIRDLGLAGWQMVGVYHNFVYFQRPKL